MNIQTALVKNGWLNQSLDLGQAVINFLLHTTERYMICLPYRTDKLQMNYMRCY